MKIIAHFFFSFLLKTIANTLMENLIKILVVEDEMIIAAKISMLLTNLGYEVTGILARGEEALAHILENKVDILLLDIRLKGSIDGIETARQIQQHSDVPIIYLTANADEATFNRAKATRPAAFISKPIKQLDLQRAIELTICRISENGKENIPEYTPTILKDRIFIRHREKMMKLLVADIFYIEADRNYSRVFTAAKEFLLCVTLKTIEEKLSPDVFVRTHRSYIVNLMHVDEVGDGYVIIGQKSIPLSAGLKERLLNRIQTL